MIKLSTVVLPLFFALSSLASMTADAKIFADITIGNHSYQGLVDSGADITIVPPEKIKPGMLIKQTGTGRFTIANGDMVRISIYSAWVSIGGYPQRKVEVAVLPGAEVPLIGMSTLEAFGVMIDTASGSLKFLAQGRPAFRYALRPQPAHPRSNPAITASYRESRDYNGHVTPGCN